MHSLSDVTFLGDDLLKNDEFVSALNDRLQPYGGVKIGEKTAWFAIGDTKYIYYEVAIPIPIRMIRSNEDVIDIFDGLVKANDMSRFVVGDKSKEKEYLSLRSAQATINAAIIYFYIRAVQV